MEKTTLPDVLTLEETSIYLRLSIEAVTNQAVSGNLPGRKIENDWRFLKAAIDDWLWPKSSRSVLLDQAGANVVSDQCMTLGMFSGQNQSNHEDSRSAEFHGDLDDSLEIDD